MPLGLVCIEAALDKLMTPKGKGLAISISVFGPQSVIAVFMMQGWVKVGVNNEEDKVLQFVVV